MEDDSDLSRRTKKDWQACNLVQGGTKSVWGGGVQQGSLLKETNKTVETLLFSQGLGFLKLSPPTLTHPFVRISNSSSFLSMPWSSS